MVTLFAELVRSGCAAEAFNILMDSKSATTLEPLRVAIQIYMGKDVSIAPEIAEVVKDIIEQLKKRMK